MKKDLEAVAGMVGKKFYTATQCRENAHAASLCAGLAAADNDRRGAASHRANQVAWEGRAANGGWIDADLCTCEGVGWGSPGDHLVGCPFLEEEAGS